MKEKSVNLNLGARSYDVIINEKSLERLPEFINGFFSKIIIITDENVAKLHMEKLDNILRKSGLKSSKACRRILIHILPTGEQTKSFAQLGDVADKILGQQIDRQSLLIAFGGGVIGDLTGFLASILLRGIHFIQIPTTLLAAVDSAVGGKTGINSKFGKNLIGSFYQPKLVLCDLDLLQSLDKREFLAGLAEVIKYGIVYDAGFFKFLEDNLERILARAPLTLQEIIKKSCEIKAEIVTKDEKECGLRAILNFGHTFGHAFEAEAGYNNNLIHGEAVAIGMIMASQMSHNLGLISKDIVMRIENLIKKSGLPISCKQICDDWNKKNLIAHLFKDKKNSNGQLNFILIKDIGQAFMQKGVNLKEFEKICS